MTLVTPIIMDAFVKEWPREFVRKHQSCGVIFADVIEIEGS